MKIITERAAYLQKYYFNILIDSTMITNKGVPLSILDVTTKRSFIKYDNKDFIKFTKKEDIDFLRETDWIVDYSEYIKMSEEDILEKISKVDQEGKELNDYFASLSEEKREEEFGILSIKAKMLNYKKQSLLDILYMVRNNQVVNLGFGNSVMKLFR